MKQILFKIKILCECNSYNFSFWCYSATASKWRCTTYTSTQCKLQLFSQYMKLFLLNMLSKILNLKIEEFTITYCYWSPHFEIGRCSCCCCCVMYKHNHTIEKFFFHIFLFFALPSTTCLLIVSEMLDMRKKRREKNTNENKRKW